VGLSSTTALIQLCTVEAKLTYYGVLLQHFRPEYLEQQALAEGLEHFWVARREKESKVHPRTPKCNP